MFERVRKIRDENIVFFTFWDGFIEVLDVKKFIMILWCNIKDSEEFVKKKFIVEFMGGVVKMLCILFE